MISNNKYIGLITGDGEYTAPAPYTGFGKVIVDLGIEPLTVSPSTETQVIEKEGGYNPVTVLPVENVLPQNIKYGESILNVEGTYGRGFLPRVVYNNILYQSSVFPDFSGINTIALQALRHGFYNNNYIRAVDMKDVQYVNAYGMVQCFRACHGLTSVDLSGLIEINMDETFITDVSSGLNETFYNCSALTSINISSLRRCIGGSAMFNTFYGCSALTSLDLGSLEYVNGYRVLGYFCGNCTNLEMVNLSKLATIQGNEALLGGFFNCSKLKELSFPALINDFGEYTTQFKNMLTSCRDVTVHFPSNLESVIGEWSDVVNGFGGTNTTVLFDLPSTEIVDENSEL